MKKSVLAALAAVMLLSGCSGVSQENSSSFVESETYEQGRYVIDYGDAESFETALKEGKNLEGKIVCFDILEYHPDSVWGYNLWAGEHLNFVSSSQPDIQEGAIVVKVTSVKNHLGSWIINYEKVENAVANDDTIVSSKDNSAPTIANSANQSVPNTSNSDNLQTETSTEKYKKDIFVVGATKCDDWYYKETETGSIEAAMYVDDYAKLDDVNEFVMNFFTGMQNVVIEAPHHGMYTYWVFKENGSLVTTTFLSSYMSMPILWLGDYEPLNDNEFAKKLNDIWCNNSETSTSQSSSSIQTEKPTESQTSPVQDTITTGERNALKKAQSYLNSIPFSRDGLIEQLEYNGFTNAEAMYGADNVGADWNDQALKKAKSYIDTMPFSYTGLIEQLEYNKFTHEQAVYGADNCGADWNEQAAKKAKSYLDIMAFSRDGLIEQLEYNGFTHDQAVYGVTQNGY